VSLVLCGSESPLTDECDEHESRQHAPRPGNPIDHERRLAAEPQSGVDRRAEVGAAPESVTITTRTQCPRSLPSGTELRVEPESPCSPHVDAGPLTHRLNEAAANSAMEIRLGLDEVEDVGAEVLPFYGVSQRVLTGLRSLPQACSVLGIVSSR
jgi:hypothetical protein